MAQISIRIKNLSEIKRAFAMSPRLMAKNLNISIRQAVLTIGRQSRMNTPVLTGRLRASTYERFSNLKGEIGTNTNYDMFVHEGTRFMRARPYLRMAVASNEGSTERFMADAVQRTLDEIGRQT